MKDWDGRTHNTLFFISYITSCVCIYTYVLISIHTYITDAYVNMYWINENYVINISK